MHAVAICRAAQLAMRHSAAKVEKAAAIIMLRSSGAGRRVSIEMYIPVKLLWLQHTAQLCHAAQFDCRSRLERRL